MAERLNIAKIYVKDGKLTPVASYSELVKLDRKELAAIAKRIFENANRRMANIRASGLAGYSEILNSIAKTDGRAFHARGKSDRELVDAIRRADFFLSQYGSKVKDVKEIERERAAISPNLTREELRAVNRIYGGLHENYPRFFEKLRKNGYSSDQYRNYVVELVMNQRREILGGLGGDLFASEKRSIKATAAEREKALKTVMRQAEKYIEAEERKLNRQVNVPRSYSSPKFKVNNIPPVVDVDIEKL